MTEKPALKFDKCFQNDDYVLLFNTRNGFEVLQGVNGKKDPFVLELPSLLDIGIMGTCVHKCKICYQGHEDKPNMTLDNFKRIIDEVAHHVNQVALGGRGDPNKHENFQQIVEYCRESGVVPNYTTSGINLTPKEVEISKMCGAVAVSAYERDFTYEAINSFTDANIKTNIHFVLSRDTYYRAIHILRGVYSWGDLIDIKKVNAIIFLLFKPQGAARDMTELIPTEYQLESFAKNIFNPDIKIKVGMDSCLVNHVTRFHTPTELQSMCLDTCEGARMSAYISPDTKFMPCSFADDSVWSEKISEYRTITDIWHSSTPFTLFRRMLKEQNKQCPLYL